MIVLLGFVYFVTPVLDSVSGNSIWYVGYRIEGKEAEIDALPILFIP